MTGLVGFGNQSNEAVENVKLVEKYDDKPSGTCIVKVKFDPNDQKAT